jgi:hypothetical protein
MDMKFMLHMNVPKGPYQMDGWSPADMKAMHAFMDEFNKGLTAAGKLVSAEGLVGPDQARIVRAGADGRPVVTDGPFAETKEFIAGYWIVEVANAEEAYAIAAKASTCPGPGGKPLNMPIEVRAAGEAPATD